MTGLFDINDRTVGKREDRTVEREHRVVVSEVPVSNSPVFPVINSSKCYTSVLHSPQLLFIVVKELRRQAVGLGLAVCASL